MVEERQKIENALDVVGGYFPDMKDACIDGHYKIEAERLVEMDEILRCIKLYVIFKGIANITGRKMEVLAYYLKYGYSRETKKKIIKEIEITDSNLNNINHELRRAGAITMMDNNQTHNELNKDLLDFKTFLVDQEKKYILVKLNDEAGV